MGIHICIDGVVREVGKVPLAINGVIKEAHSGFLERGNAIYAFYGDPFKNIERVIIRPIRRVITRRDSAGSSESVSDVTFTSIVTNEAIENVGEWSINGKIVYIKAYTGYAIDLYFYISPIYPIDKIGEGGKLSRLLAKYSPAINLSSEVLLQSSPSNLSGRAYSVRFFGQAPTTSGITFGTQKTVTFDSSSGFGYNKNAYDLRLLIGANSDLVDFSAFTLLQFSLTKLSIAGVNYSISFVEG